MIAEVSNYGVPALLLLLVFREGAALIKLLVDKVSKNGKNGNGGGQDIKELQSSLTSLAFTLDTVSEKCCKTDEDGVPLMYVPRRLVKMLERQVGVMERHTVLLEQVVQRLDSIATEVSRRD